MKFIKGLSLSACLLILMSSVTLHAYQDEIDAPYGEVYQSIVRVCERQGGLKSASLEDNRVVSDWSFDQVMRRNKGLLRALGFKKSFNRRTRYTVEFERWPTYTAIRVKAHLEYRPADAGKATVWRSLNPGSEALELEKMLFIQILRDIENQRYLASHPLES